ncbi:hypothetical protein [Planctomyces sp. SH-PL14]|uniref:hypothetical protein n=1 Tax=Planctomyces sp. SH-PL14 TaxID=1632864 RepID=UPI00078CFCB6|nr:hypothetical protein [Planctomyces sp. SH-PL14]AMV16586.1 hypothetical protein VT03_01770 [Planctomyces sp. SH-PL14]
MTLRSHTWGHSDGHRVYCDGEDMGRKVFAAQSGSDGWVDRYVTDGNGRILVDATGRAPRVERCTGNVVVDLAEDGVLRSAPQGKNLGIIEDGTHGIARHGTAVRGRSAATPDGSFPGRRPGKPHSLPDANQHSPSA